MEGVMKSLRGLVGAVIISFSVSASAQTTGLPTLPLPPDISLDIQQAPVNIPEQYAKFIGKWGGYWGGVLASNLYVEDVTPSGDARGVYAWGTSDIVKASGAIKFRARIKNDVLSWGDVQRGIGFEFRVTPEGKLKGDRFNHGGQAGAVVMSKME
jgi:hypothetical protein